MFRMTLDLCNPQPFFLMYIATLPAMITENCEVEVDTEINNLHIPSSNPVSSIALFPSMDVDNLYFLQSP